MEGKANAKAKERKSPTRRRIQGRIVCTSNAQQQQQQRKQQRRPALTIEDDVSSLMTIMGLTHDNTTFLGVPSGRNDVNTVERLTRLQIMAMHEMCEIRKCPGFEFQVNLERTHQALLKLFQIYDDRRNGGGVDISVEKEFHGYYALLRLNNMMDTAVPSVKPVKMVPEVRTSNEVRFARDVARKATYLQACLMHTRFSKVRTQALASLHSGLSINKGIPIADVTKWLALEGEDVDGLLKHHGFIVKEMLKKKCMVKD